jgi:hypothetical protein
MPPSKNTLQKVLELTGTFVAMQKGSWEHADWEHLLGKLEAQGVIVDDESKRNLGNILEASKYFYFLAPAAPAKKKAAAKKKPAAKAKAGR